MPPLAIGERKIPRRKGSRVACEACGRRKVRCDGIRNGFPCGNCRLDDVPCAMRSLKKKANVPGDSVLQSSKNDSMNPLALFHGTNKVESMGGSTAKEDSITRHRSAVSAVFPDGSDDGHINSRSTTKPNIINSIIGSRVPFSFYAFLKRPRFGHLHPWDVEVLDSQGCLHVPGGHLMDTWIRHYFLYVHPCMPLLDEAKFWEMYRHPDEFKNTFSLLLFQSMLFSAASFIPLEIAMQCGYISLVDARNELYQRAKLLYSMGLENDRFAIAQATLLLSYYNSNSQILTNSNWLSIAVHNAKAEGAHQYYCAPGQTEKRILEHKKLWWCCILRDRIISLGMRRPIQILEQEFDLDQQCLTPRDLGEEISNSEVYTPTVKMALCGVLAVLCRLAVALTGVSVIVYPETAEVGLPTMRANTELERINRAISNLLLWEKDFIEEKSSDKCKLHSSVALNIHLTWIYYQSARIALYNHICLTMGSSNSLHPQTFLMLENSKLGFMAELTSIANSVKELVTAGIAKYLPVSATAYTVLPFVLLQADSRLSYPIAGVRKHDKTLEYFAEINHSYSLRYDTTRVLLFAQEALHLVEIRGNGGGIATDNEVTMPGQCNYRALVYSRLSQFLDESISSMPLAKGNGRSSGTDYPLHERGSDILPNAQNMDDQTKSFFDTLNSDGTPSQQSNDFLSLPIADSGAVAFDETQTQWYQEGMPKQCSPNLVAEDSLCPENLLNDLFRFGE